jgi:hypothetical protein
VQQDRFPATAISLYRLPDATPFPFSEESHGGILTVPLGSARIQ